MTSRDRWTLLIGALLLIGVGVYVVQNLRITTDIEHFIAEEEDRRLASMSRQIMDSELSRTMVLTLTSDDPSGVPAASRRFETLIREQAWTEEGLSFLEGGPPEGVDQALWDLYEPRRLSFFANVPENVGAALTDDALHRAAQRLRTELTGMMSPMISRVAPQDPFLTLPDLFQELERARANDLTLREGRFVTRDGRTAVLFLGTTASAFDADAQTPVLEGIAQAFQTLNNESSDTLTLDQSGVNRFATRAATSIQSDIQRISILSVVFLGILLIALFRSARLVGLAALPVGAGVLAGCAAVLASYGQLHGITLAFGASLIGVSIDYVVHLYCHHSIVRPEGGPRASLHHILRPLATGALTTLAGFCALGASSLIGLREVALFSIAGIVTAFGVTFTLMPALMPSRSPDVRLRTRLVATLERTLEVLRRQRRRLWVVPAIAIIIMAVSLPSLHWNANFGGMGELDAELLEEDARVRARVTRYEQMRFIVAMGDSEANALLTNDRVSDILAEAQQAGNIEAYRSIASLLPSPARQRAVREAVRADSTMPTRFTRAFQEAGFADGVFHPFLGDIESNSAPEPLTYDALMATPLRSIVRLFRITAEQRVAFVTFLSGVENLPHIVERLDDIPNVVVLQQDDLLGQAHEAYQRRTSELLAFGLIAVLLLLALRYRKASRVIAAIVPSLLAVGVTLSVLTWAGIGVDLVNLTALLFVLSMGVDYGVFLVDAHEQRDPLELAAALTSIAVAGVSTIIGFGLLAGSSYPVLASLGITATTGIFANLILAPTALFLFQTNETPRENRHA